MNEPAPSSFAYPSCFVADAVRGEYSQHVVRDFLRLVPPRNKTANG